MRLDTAGRPFSADIEVPDDCECRACGGRANRQTSAWQGEGITYHHYRCRARACPAGGVIVEHEHERGQKRFVGPVFGDSDLAVHLATREREYPDVPAEAREAEA